MMLNDWIAAGAVLGSFTTGGVALFAALFNGNGRAAESAVENTPVYDIKPTAPLVQVKALIGNALMLKDGTFVRMLEIAPVDLEGNDEARRTYWVRFSSALKALHWPLSIQIVVLSRPQFIDPYLDRLARRTSSWLGLASQTADIPLGDRRVRMAERCERLMDYLRLLYRAIVPTQHRYLIAIPYNPLTGLPALGNKPPDIDLKQIGKAMAKLDECAQLVQSLMESVGVRVIELDALHAAEAVWQHYHPVRGLYGSTHSLDLPLEQLMIDARSHLLQCPSYEEFAAMARDERALANALAPISVDRSDTNRLGVGDVVGRGYILFDFNVSSKVGVSAVLSYPAMITHSFFISPTDPVRMRQSLSLAETEMRSRSFLDQRQQRITNWGNEAAINDAETLRAQVEINAQSPFDLRWFCMLWANDPASLEEQCQRFESMLKSLGVRFRSANLKQIELFQSMQPLGRLEIGIEPRNMTAESLGPFFPFSRREYFSPNGWFYGVHRHNGLFVVLDSMEGGNKNGSQLVVGASGSGKSSYLKQLIDTLLARGDRVIVIDPEREYLRMAVDHHGAYLELGGGRTAQPFPFDPTQPEPFNEGWERLCVVFNALSERPLTEMERDLLAEHYEAALGDAGIVYGQPDTWQQTPSCLKTLIARLLDDPDTREIGRVLSYPAEALSGGWKVNPLDVKGGEGGDPWMDVTSSVISFVSVHYGGSLGATMESVLDKHVRRVLLEYGVNMERKETWDHPRPRLSALVNSLAADPDPDAQSLTKIMGSLTGRYGHLFDVDTTVNIGEQQFVVFGLKSVRDSMDDRLLPLLSWQALQLAWNEIVRGATTRDQATHLIVDEAWLLLQNKADGFDVRAGSAARLAGIARSVRKNNAELIVATQEIEKLWSNPESRALMQLGRVRVLLGQSEDTAAAAVGEAYRLSADEVAGIRYAKQGDMLLMIDNLRVPLKVWLDPKRLDLYSMNAEEQSRIAEALGRRSAPVR